MTLILAATLGLTACKKEGCTDPTALNYDSDAKKDDGSCTFEETPAYTVPSTYAFTDGSGNSTVDFSGQTERLNQLQEIIEMMESGEVTTIDAQALKDMFANVNGNGNGYFSFSSSKQLKDKCFPGDASLFESWMENAALASQSNATAAAPGQAGTLSSGTSTYLFDDNGHDNAELVEKGLMGAVFMYQALNVYFGAGKMDVDNTAAVDPGNGQYYTAMEHHWDEAFGYFGVPLDYPSTLSDRFWGEYCHAQDASLNSNSVMMSNFLKGRAAIGANVLTDRDAAILQIRTMWENISAHQAMTYLDAAIGYFGNDNARFLHALSEAYGFAWNLRYAPLETRRMDNTEHASLMAMFNTDFWSMSVSDLNAIKNTISAKF